VGEAILVLERSIIDAVMTRALQADAVRIRSWLWISWRRAAAIW
jgi:hypothetical protein